MGGVKAVGLAKEAKASKTGSGGVEKGRSLKLIATDMLEIQVS
jgi:hypothetical protein